MDQKPIAFVGTALEDLRTFPEDARQTAGYQLGEVQNGRMPTDFKPMPTIGQGCYEIRIHEASGAYRVVYVARFPEAVYVLHCFTKKTQKTSKPDLTTAERRYRQLIEERRHD